MQHLWQKCEDSPRPCAKSSSSSNAKHLLLREESLSLSLLLVSNSSAWRTSAQRQTVVPQTSLLSLTTNSELKEKVDLKELRALR